MIFALKKLVPLFFAMDHQNYARWVPIFIRDLENLPPDVQAQFETGNWTIRISNHRFSSMPIDQAHEQLNKRVKGVGGVIGLTESPFMLEKWAMTGPEIARVLSEFSGDSDDPEILPHHNEGFSSQKRFKEHVVDLLEVILANINPFDEHSQQLVTLDNKVCESPAASASVRTIDSLGKEQYTTYRKNVLDSNVTALSAPIKRNNLLLFHEVKIRKVSSVKLKVQHFKNQTDLFGKAFLMADSRGGPEVLKTFFQHESSQYPPSLSSEEAIYSNTKSDLLTCILETSSEDDSSGFEPIAPKVYDFIVLDGGALIHSITGSSQKGTNFDAFYERVFFPRVLHDMNRTKRLDIVWDRYSQFSIKESAREKRGKSTRKRVDGSAKVPGEWHDFLLNPDNKNELFRFLSNMLSSEKLLKTRLSMLLKMSKFLISEIARDLWTIPTTKKLIHVF